MARACHSVTRMMLSKHVGKKLPRPSLPLARRVQVSFALLPSLPSASDFRANSVSDSKSNEVRRRKGVDLTNDRPRLSDCRVGLTNFPVSHHNILKIGCVTQKINQQKQASLKCSVLHLSLSLIKLRQCITSSKNLSTINCIFTKPGGVRLFPSARIPCSTVHAHCP